VRAQVVSEQQPTDVQNLVWFIPGTDPGAGEIIFSAHLYEGYVKQGGNDDISGCAAPPGDQPSVEHADQREPHPKAQAHDPLHHRPRDFGPGLWSMRIRNHARTLCNINLDMVGEWLSKNQSFFCLIRTTYGNAHYINDVMENIIGCR